MRRNFNEKNLLDQKKASVKGRREDIFIAVLLVKQSDSSSWHATLQIQIRSDCKSFFRNNNSFTVQTDNIQLSIVFTAADELFDGFFDDSLFKHMLGINVRD